MPSAGQRTGWPISTWLIYLARSSLDNYRTGPVIRALPFPNGYPALQRCGAGTHDASGSILAGRRVTVAGSKQASMQAK